MILRRLRPESHLNLFSTVLWDTPSPPEMKRPNFFSVAQQPHLRFRYVPFHEKVTGLTVYCRWKKFFGIHAHVEGDFSTSALDRDIKSASNVSWVYFPINIGERVQNVWVRTKNRVQGSASDPTIVVGKSSF